MEHLADFQTHVQPNEVGKRQRPHRMIESKLNRCVNVIHIGDPLNQNKAGFVQHGQEDAVHDKARRSEEHTSELQSLMRISYAVFCWKEKKLHQNIKSDSEYESTYKNKQL